MSSDSNPVKRFRSLSGAPEDSKGKEPDKRPVPPQGNAQPGVPAPTPHPYSSPPDAPVKPPAPPPWQKTPPAQEPNQWPQPTSAYAPNQYPPNPYPPVTRPGPSPDTAYVIELIGGLFGLFGLGYMYAGQTGSGTTRLIIGILCDLVVGFLSAITAGIFACIALPIYLVVAILSASAVKKLLLNQNHP